MTSMKIVQFLKTPTHLFIYVQTSSIPLTLDVRFQTPSPLHSPNDNQSKENIIQGWLLFAQLENVNKLWSNNRTAQMNKQDQSKNKSKSRVTFIQRYEFRYN